MPFIPQATDLAVDGSLRDIEVTRERLGRDEPVFEEVEHTLAPMCSAVGMGAHHRASLNAAVAENLTSSLNSDLSMTQRK